MGKVFPRQVLKEKLFAAAKEIDSKSRLNRGLASEKTAHFSPYKMARQNIAVFVLSISDFAKSPKERSLLLKLLLSPYYHSAQAFAEKKGLASLDQKKVQRLASILIRLKEASRQQFANDFVSNGAAHCLGNLMVLEAAAKHPKFVREQRKRARDDIAIQKRILDEQSQLDKQLLVIAAQRKWLESQGERQRIFNVLSNATVIQSFSSEEVLACQKAIDSVDVEKLKDLLKKHSLRY